MPRPSKNNAEYFSHDNNMRNDPKIKALRRKFGHEGYSVYNMLLELLCASDFFEYDFSETEVELVAGDFDTDPGMLTDILNYGCQVKLFERSGTIIYSRGQKRRLQPVLDKRTREKDRFLSQNEKNNDVSVAETTQKKVKESTRKESKKNISIKPPLPETAGAVPETVFDENTETGNPTPEVNKNIEFEAFWNLYDKKVGNLAKLIKKWDKLNEQERKRIMDYIPRYKIAQPDKAYRKNPETFLNNKSWNDEIITKPEPPPPNQQGKNFPNYFSKSFENTLSSKECGAYWSHLRLLGFVPKKDSQQTIVDWIKPN